MSRAHGVMRSTFVHPVGSIREQCYSSENPNDIYHPFAISLQLPFLCTTPDFINRKLGPSVAEIETCEKKSACHILFNNIPKIYAFQIWPSCEILGIRKAKLKIYHYDMKGDKKNKYGNYKWVSEFGYLDIEIVHDFFSEEVSKKLIEAYMKAWCDFLTM